MIIGKLDKRIQIYRPTFTQNNYGERSASFTLYGSRWAQVFHSTGGSKAEYEAESFVNTANVDFIIRFDSSITTADKILYKSQYYYITEIQEINRDEALRLKTKLKVDIS